jgi:heptosyltransferase-1
VSEAGRRATGTRRFLIVRLGALGDVVHAIPAAAAIKASFPDASLDWLVEPGYVGLLRLVSCVDGVVPVDPRRGLSHVYDTVQGLRRSHYDAVVDLQGLLKSAVLARLAGAPLTVGFPAAHLREPVARLFYSHAPDLGPASHVIHKNLALLVALGVRTRKVAFPLVIPDSASEERVRARHAAGYVLINPGAAWPNKRWPPERFGAAAVAIRASVGLPSVVLWGPGEEALAASVVASSEGAAELAPPTSIIDVCAMARGARVVLSGDTGPLHLAAATGTPVVGLFGPTHAERNGPWSASDVVVARTDRCQCQYERLCRRAAGSAEHPCMEDIGVDEVVAAVERRLSARG